jgi:hypothetical protein
MAMEIRVGESLKRLTAPGVLPTAPDSVEIRKAKPGVTEDQLIAAIDENKRDEILVRGDDEALYLLSASKLNVRWRLGFPTPGERVTIGDIEGNIVHADNERNIAHIIGRVAMGASVLAPVAGIAYGMNLVVNAPSIGEFFINLLTFGRNALIGTAVSGGAALLPGGVAAVVDGVKDEARGEALDQLTDVIGTS